MENEVKTENVEIKENLKLVSTMFCQIFIFSPSDGTLKTMKNVLYFI